MYHTKTSWFKVKPSPKYFPIAFRWYIYLSGTYSCISAGDRVMGCCAAPAFGKWSGVRKGNEAHQYWNQGWWSQAMGRRPQTQRWKNIVVLLFPMAVLLAQCTWSPCPRLSPVPAPLWERVNNMNCASGSPSYHTQVLTPAPFRCWRGWPASVFAAEMRKTAPGKGEDDEGEEEEGAPASLNHWGKRINQQRCFAWQVWDGGCMPLVPKPL